MINKIIIMEKCLFFVVLLSGIRSGEWQHYW